MTKTIQDFWIRCYLGSIEHSDYIDLSINRAYRDLNRTIHGMKNINPELEITLILTTLKRFKLTTLKRSMLTTPKRSMLTT